VENKKHWVEEIFEKHGATLKGHFFLSSAAHSNKYLDKILVYSDTRGIADICRSIAFIAFHETEEPIEVVVGPEKGGIILAHEVARGLTEHTLNEARPVFTEKDSLHRQVLRESFKKIIAGRRVLVVDDILTTGKSVRQIIKAVEECYGRVVGVGAICNRGKVTSQDIGGYPLFVLWETEIESWLPEECPLCKAGVPLTDPKAL